VRRSCLPTFYTSNLYKNADVAQLVRAADL
jgi:hypothetical protein